VKITAQRGPPVSIRRKAATRRHGHINGKRGAGATIRKTDPINGNPDTNT